MRGLDAIVCGSVAVTRDGRRCGKGEGYSDLEFAIRRELGHPAVPVATTVHDLQIYEKQGVTVFDEELRGLNGDAIWDDTPRQSGFAWTHHWSGMDSNLQFRAR
jgi:hypothetical protein